MNVAFGTGCGAVALTGPLTDGVVIAWWMRADEVVVIDPAHVLPSRAEAAADPHLEREEHRAERTARRAEDQPRSEEDHANPRPARRERPGLPFTAEIGQKALAGPAGFGQPFGAAVPVQSDRRRRHQDAGGAAQPVEGFGQQLRALHPASPYGSLLRRCPAAARQALAGEVDQPVDPLQGVAVDTALHRIPEDLPASLSGLSPHDRQHPVASRGQEVAKRGPDEAAGTGDRDRQARSPRRASDAPCRAQSGCPEKRRNAGVRLRRRRARRSVRPPRRAAPTRCGP